VIPNYPKISSDGVYECPAHSECSCSIIKLSKRFFIEMLSPVTFAAFRQCYN
jgi:hypothetical protein